LVVLLLLVTKFEELDFAYAIQFLLCCVGMLKENSESLVHDGKILRCLVLPTKVQFVLYRMPEC
jgi:hypothetical protein